MGDRLELSENRAVASRVPARSGIINISLSGPQVGSWTLDHLDEDLSAFGFFVAGGGPDLTVRVIARRSCGAGYLDGHVDLGLVVDRAEFANTFEAAQIALERLERLPDAGHLSHASLRIEVEEGNWR